MVVKWFPTKKGITPGEIAIIGLGNIDRGDDGIGIYCAEILQASFEDMFSVFTESEYLIDEIILDLLEDEKIKKVIFFDAADFGELPATYLVLNNWQELQTEISSHRIPLKLYMQLLKTAGKESCLFAIQYRSLEYGNQLTPPLRNFLDNFASIFTEEFNHL